VHAKINTHTHTHTHIHTHTHTNTHTYTHIHTNTHTDTQASTHTDTHKQAHTRTHTHTHKYTSTSVHVIPLFCFELAILLVLVSLARSRNVAGHGGPGRHGAELGVCISRPLESVHA
jgi:hypothetical protein